MAAFLALVHHPTYVGRPPKWLLLLGYLSTSIASLLGMWTVATNGAAFPALLSYILTGVAGAALWIWTGREAAAEVPADIMEALEETSQEVPAPDGQPDEEAADEDTLRPPAA